MMDKEHMKLTLDCPATYQIKVPGEINQGWADWSGILQIRLEPGDPGPPITVLTTIVDQAALQGLLRRIYSLGLPLISVICKEFGSED
jgi:hypothetical protein